MQEPLLDKTFLKDLFNSRTRETYVKITTYSRQGIIQETIEGKATGGSITIETSHDSFVDAIGTYIEVNANGYDGYEIANTKSFFKIYPPLYLIKFDDIIKYNLEPVIYSFRILDDFTQTASMYCDVDDKIKIHIEMDTGMHRLGFMEDDMPLLIEKLNANKAVKVCSIFSHLACSEDATMDAFTLSQIDKFKRWSAELKAALKGQDKILCHILNSSGIVRFGEAEMDMVRLGIGLYGVAPDPEVQKHLTLISKLKTKISQSFTVITMKTLSVIFADTLCPNTSIRAKCVQMNMRIGTLILADAKLPKIQLNTAI